MHMAKLLFVCTENKLRSQTAENIFSKYDGIEAIGCGTYKDARTPLSGDLIEWADIVFVMEKSHKEKVAKRYRDHLKGKRLICLDIPDRYALCSRSLRNCWKLKLPST
jgi:predicted protein tyrosine phosphatase